MTMTDPIADMLTRIRNGIQVRRQSVDMPSSRAKSSIALVLKEGGYIKDVEALTDDKGFGVLRLHLKYNLDGVSAITEIIRISKPGCRIYSGSADLPVVRNGLGTTIVSTSQGVMNERKARELGVGGEVLCTVF